MLVHKILHYFSNQGSLPEQPYSFENRRILLLNKVVLVTIVVTILVVLTHIIIGNTVQSLVVSLGFLVSVPTLWFQHKNKYQLARNWFLLGFFILISMVFLNSVQLNLETSTEYVLIILIPMTLIFIDGKASTFATLFIVLCGSLFIYYRYDYFGNESVKQLYGLQINWLTICIAVYVCVVFFKRSLIRVNKILERDKSKLTEADRTKNFLFGVISHDIRSPLSTLKQYLLLDPSVRQDPNQFMQYQEGLTKKIDEISNTLNDLLYWSKTQLQGIQVNPTTFGLTEVVNNILPVIKELIKVKRIDFQTKDELGSRMWCDKDHLTVILRNLIQNAIKFTPVEGKLTIHAYALENEMRISVTDTGDGMDDTTLKNLQEGAITASRLGTAGEVGTGLGLSLVKELIEKNNGQLLINSKVHSGTTITVSFKKRKP